MTEQYSGLTPYGLVVARHLKWDKEDNIKRNGEYVDEDSIYFAMTSYTEQKRERMKKIIAEKVSEMSPKEKEEYFQQVQEAAKFSKEFSKRNLITAILQNKSK